MGKQYLYQTIKRSLINQIESGRYRPLDRLPSETELMREHQVGRNTARRVLEDLVKEGYAKRIQGKGSFVENTRIVQDLEMGLRSLSDLFNAHERRCYSKHVHTSEVDPPERVRRALGLADDDKALRIVRVRYADDTPAILNEMFISYNRFSSLLKCDLEVISFYDYLYKVARVVPNKVTEILEIIKLYPEEAALLDQKPGEPAFLLRGITSDQNGRPFEMVRSIYRADMFQFGISLRR